MGASRKAGWISADDGICRAARPGDLSADAAGLPRRHHVQSVKAVGLAATAATTTAASTSATPAVYHAGAIARIEVLHVSRAGITHPVCPSSAPGFLGGVIARATPRHARMIRVEKECVGAAGSHRTHRHQRKGRGCEQSRFHRHRHLHCSVSAKPQWSACLFRRQTMKTGSVAVPKLLSPTGVNLAQAKGDARSGKLTPPAPRGAATAAAGRRRG